METTSLNPDELETLQRVIHFELKQRPPTIGIIGVSGVGKSSTINKLFKTSLPTSPTTACTKDFEQLDLPLPFVQGQAKGEQTTLRIVDAPGLAEDVGQDPKYLQMYEQHLPECDVILWVLAARNRAIALDQMYLQQLSQFHPKMVFAINQIDIVDPLDWNHKINSPSSLMKKNIEEIVQYRGKKLSAVLNRNIVPIPYSATTGFNLQKLFTSLLYTCDEDRAWIFDGLKNFHFTDFIPAKALALLKKDGVL